CARWGLTGTRFDFW
nr:immunoglobulin heavy chain junction region [Mus musculus]